MSIRNTKRLQDSKGYQRECCDDECNLELTRLWVETLVVFRVYADAEKWQPNYIIPTCSPLATTSVVQENVSVPDLGWYGLSARQYLR